MTCVGDRVWAAIAWKLTLVTGEGKVSAGFGAKMPRSWCWLGGRCAYRSGCQPENVLATTARRPSRAVSLTSFGSSNPTDIFSFWGPPAFLPPHCTRAVAVAVAILSPQSVQALYKQNDGKTLVLPFGSSLHLGAARPPSLSTLLSL
jgi:hypothetical protein